LLPRVATSATAPSSGTRFVHCSRVARAFAKTRAILAEPGTTVP
jgi:hypothetical protein